MLSPSETLPWRLDWTEALSMFIPEIDAEHRHFMKLVNELNEAIVARMAVSEVKNRMRAIQDDARAHFAHEEALFREWGYPDAEEHAKKHAEAIQFFSQTEDEFSHDRTGYEWIEAGLRVKQVLIEHLLIEDMKYRDYSRKNGKL
jgi:hemerythrin-like metal-binding protein